MRKPRRFPFFAGRVWLPYFTLIFRILVSKLTRSTANYKMVKSESLFESRSVQTQSSSFRTLLFLLWMKWPFVEYARPPFFYISHDFNMIFCAVSICNYVQKFNATSQQFLLAFQHQLASETLESHDMWHEVNLDTMFRRRWKKKSSNLFCRSEPVHHRQLSCTVIPLGAPRQLTWVAFPTVWIRAKVFSIKSIKREL